MPRATPATAILDGALGAPPDQRTIAEQVADRLRDLIVSGSLPPGTPLRVNPLAERLGMSAMPVRDALKLLEVERLVESTPRRGAVVSALSEEDVEEIYAMRAGLESLLTRHATVRACQEDHAVLRELFAAMETIPQVDDLDAFKAADRAFHDHLYGLAGRERTLRTVAELQARSRRYQRFVYLHRRLLDAALAEHREILDAVLARDAVRAERLTHHHLMAAQERLLAAIRDGQPLPSA